ncbi:MAG: hypothetical protein PHD48_11230 [Alphaproteobacteria bacterium]|nr:hypothetical protein [Alphaproteobacteria bacterium]
MVLEELEQRYGVYLAELIRQALTLEEFHRLEIEELSAYFALRAARTSQEYSEHREAPLADDGRAVSVDTYQGVLRRRWQAAENLAQMVIHADREAAEADGKRLA